jgi:cation transport ATPase
MKTNERPQFRDCPACGAGGIIPDEGGNCTHCGSNIESPTATAEHVEREGTKDATQTAEHVEQEGTKDTTQTAEHVERVQERAKEPFMPISSCPSCSSTQIKKNFLAVPPVFGISSATISVLLIVSGLITILVGLSDLVNTQTIQVGSDTYVVAQETDTWTIAIKVIVGTVVVLIAIMGLSRRNYTCWSCGNRFFTPSEISTGNADQLKTVEIKP